MTPYVADRDLTLWHGDALTVLRRLPSRSVDAVVTSPPYADARDEIDPVSLEEWPAIFGELRRVTRGAIAFNVGRRWRDGEEWLWWLPILDAARGAGWALVDSLVWVKPNANPIRGRIVADSHEFVLVLAAAGWTFDPVDLRTDYSVETLARMRRRWARGSGVKGDTPGGGMSGERQVNENGARPRSFLVRYVGGEKGNPHPTPMPLELAADLVALVSRHGDTILDPFIGSGTTARAARLLGRSCVGIELELEWCELAANGLAQQTLETLTIDTEGRQG